jgi:general secretion pathway protein E
MRTTRKLEPQLAPAFHAVEQSETPNPEELHATIRTLHLFEDAIAARASDIHLDSHGDEYCIRFRIDGTLHDVAMVELEEGIHFLRYFRTMAELGPPKPHVAQNGRIHMNIHGEPWEIRMSTAPAALGDKVALRLLNRKQLEIHISDLGMSSETLQAIRNWTEDSTGMLVVAGPTGSGKTTTLYALLHELKMRQRSIVTIEDPVEYQIEGITQIPVHEANGLSFAEGLKAMLRLDPDYLLVGEIRDRDSAGTAIDAAGAGRILLSTLHSRDAVGVITMLRNYGIEDYEIASALEIVVAQRLVRRLCEKCKKLEPPTDAEKRWMDRLGMEYPKDCWHATGCKDCSLTGFHGRLGVFEVWQLSEECDQSILNHADELHLRKALLTHDHPILLQDGLIKAAQGLTTLTELQGMGASSQGYLLNYPHRTKM